VKLATLVAHTHTHKHTDTYIYTSTVFIFIFFIFGLADSEISLSDPTIYKISINNFVARAKKGCPRSLCACVCVCICVVLVYVFVLDVFADFDYLAGANDCINVCIDCHLATPCPLTPFTN